MKQHRCQACGYIFKRVDVSFDALPATWSCPLCGALKEQFEIGDEFTKKEVATVQTNENIYKAVVIDRNNPAIERVEGCINCGICMRTCLQRVHMDSDPDCLVCVGCGQCILTCPKKVLQPKNSIFQFLGAKNLGKTCVAYLSPASRVAIGDAFGYEPGFFLESKLIGLLRQLGFDYVYDVTFGADLTVWEEATELLDRIHHQGVLPMISSCCPSWVRYAEIFYPKILPYLSTCKSPIGMQGAVVKKYFSTQKEIKPRDLFTVAITPCTAKKWEIQEVDGTDCVITIAELVSYIQSLGIDFKKIKDSKFDTLFGSGSGSGYLFGNTGGVLESVLRAAQYFETNKPGRKINFTEVHGYHGLKEAEYAIGDLTLKVAAVDEMTQAIPLLEAILKGTCSYDFIGIMNCRGGCIGGGGLSYYKPTDEERIKKARMDSLYLKDKVSSFRHSYENKDCRKLYKELLKKPGSEEAKSLLHTTHTDLSYLAPKKAHKAEKKK